MQKSLDFPGTVFGVERPQPVKTIMPDILTRYTKAMARHKEDKIVESNE